MSNRDDARGIGLVVRPSGIVVDDKPNPLLNSIETWMRKKMPGLQPQFRQRKAGKVRGLLRELGTADFLLVDHRLEGAFEGRTGLEIALEARRAWPKLPIYLYTAFRAEVETSDAFVQIQQDALIKYFPKQELEAEKRLPELCRDIVLAGFPQAFARVQVSAKDLMLLLRAEVEAVEEHWYVCDRVGPRSSVRTLTCVSRPALGTLDVSKNQLEKAGVGAHVTDITLKVVTFSGGQVLSFFTSKSAGPGELSDQVRDILGTEEK